MSKTILRIIKYGIFGTGIAMIVFILSSLIMKVDNNDLLNYATLLLVLGFINGCTVIINDYIKPITFTILHFILTFIMLLFTFLNYNVIRETGLSIFYLFEILFSIYIIYFVILYIKDIINGNKINEKLGITDNDHKMKLFLSKVFIIYGLVLNILPDMFISLFSFVLIIIGFLIMIKYRVKNKYPLYALILNSITIIINLFLLCSTFLVINSGGNVSIGLFDGLLVCFVNLGMNIIITILSIYILSKKTYQIL